MKQYGAGAFGLILLLAGCASHDDAPDRGHVVIGSGSDQDHQDIEASNQLMFQTERAGIPSASANTSPASAPAAPKPTNP